jgi:hypothetical protein
MTRIGTPCVNVKAYWYYFRLSGLQFGLLLNFNAVRMTDGIRRLVCSGQTIDEKAAP